MKLNSDIVFDNLKELTPAEMYGPKDAELHLERPEFYLGDERTFLANHLYFAKTDRLPQRPIIEKGAVIVCIGDREHLAYYRERCCIIRIKGNDNLLSVFNLVQGVFDKYDAWSDKLNEILNSNASVKEIAECSRAIFENPIFVIDANFHFLAYSGYADPAPEEQENTDKRPDDNDNLRLPVLGQFLELHEPSMHVKEPLLFNLLDSSTLNINLFENGDYIGCLTIDYRLRAHRVSDIVLGKLLAKMITLSLQKYSAVLSNEKGALRQILQDAIDGLPTNTNQRRVLEAANLSREYVCVKMQFSNRFARLPIGYLCTMVENNFLKSIAFEYDSSIVGFIKTETIRGNDGLYKDRLRDIMKPFIQSMDMRVGVSNAFNDLYSARLYYRQACAALENGSLLHSTERYYNFENYALMEMIVNSLGELPVDLFFSEGMRRLAEHDASSQVSYLNTLRVYLNQNMSITKTASTLYIHRSTLLERLARIERELDTDLKNPDERLRMQIVLKAMKIQERIRGKSDNKALQK